MNKLVAASVIAAVGLIVTAGVGARQDTERNMEGNPSASAVRASFEGVKNNPVALRIFLSKFPKGGDLHNHLVGAIYAERYISWAAEDGLCINAVTNAIVPPETGKACKMSATQALSSGPIRDTVINALSMRSYVPSPGWAGHDQFFSTFGKMFYSNTYQYGKGPLRSGDMLAEVSKRAAHQNLAYLELMHTMELGSILSVVSPNFGEKEHTIEGLYAALMRGPFGKALPTMVSSARAHLDLATNRKDKLLNCENGAAGCDVKLLFLHQVIREFSSPQVFAQLILGAELARTDHRMVGLNMVAPEHGAVAMADYDKHMRMIDFLWKKEKEAGGELNVTLHAGELTLGLVPPEGLKNHIRSAIEVAHAKRIGHGVDINYETNSEQLLQSMADKNIMVEINLSSNESILGVKGKNHPYSLYKSAGVPLALSTDDEGVSRIDITHEYTRVVLEQGASYDDLLMLSRNSLTYSFVPGASLWGAGSMGNADCASDIAQKLDMASEKCSAFLNTSDKAMLQWQLEKKINQFEGLFTSLVE